MGRGHPSKPTACQQRRVPSGARERAWCRSLFCPVAAPQRPLVFTRLVGSGWGPGRITAYRITLPCLFRWPAFSRGVTDAIDGRKGEACITVHQLVGASAFRFAVVLPLCRDGGNRLALWLRSAHQLAACLTDSGEGLILRSERETSSRL